MPCAECRLYQDFNDRLVAQMRDERVILAALHARALQRERDINNGLRSALARAQGVAPAQEGALTAVVPPSSRSARAP